MATVHAFETPEVVPRPLWVAPACSARPRMTEDEFVAWCDEDVKAEWVDGEVVIMSPSSHRHVDLTRFLFRILDEYVERHGLGKVLGPEFMIRLPEQARRRAPALLFVARDHLDRIRPNHLEGPPDLAIEIVSTESITRDWREKLLEYQAAGVAEYWIIDPVHGRAELNILDGEAYRQADLREGRLESAAVPGFFVRPEWLGADPLPKVHEVARELGLPG